MGSSITKGTGSPLYLVNLRSSAYKMPQTMPVKYSPIITSAAYFGKNAAEKNA